MINLIKCDKIMIPVLLMMIGGLIQTYDYTIYLYVCDCKEACVLARRMLVQIKWIFCFFSESVVYIKMCLEY